jgi:uncharacterized protein (TIGR03435 family)
MRVAAASLATGVLISSVLLAQTPRIDHPAYDVVSVKPNKSGVGDTRSGRHPGGGWFMVNMATAFLIREAYPTKVDELIGAPEWVMSERFDVDARATFVPTIAQERMMLRALLADRFTFTAHYETRERPIYNLVIARADGRLPAQLRRIEIDCATYKPQPRASTPAAAAGDAAICGHRMHGGASGLSILSGGRNMQWLGDMISNAAGRPVLDKTALEGYYTYTLEYTLGLAGTDGSSIFTALQEQLGLKLEAARAPLDVVVIDHIERPTEN